MNDVAAPLTSLQLQTLVQLLNELSPDQVYWVSGFVAGYVNRGTANGPIIPAAQNAAREPATVTILFGSQTGNADQLARELGNRLQQVGRKVRVESMASFKPSQLKRETELLLITSTHGEGEPPDNAHGFHQFLLSPKAPRLENLRYAVLALGDSSYEHFCKTGRDFDERLAELGAEALLDRIDCDIDYEVAAATWMDSVSSLLSQPVVSATAAVVYPDIRGQARFSKKNPFASRLLENIPLTGPDSSKDVRHIALSLEGSGLRYTPGDALGVKPDNWPVRVTQIIEALNLYHADMVEVAPGSSATLENALLHDFEITTLTRPFLEKYAELSQSAALQGLLKADQRSHLQAWLHGREIIDVIRQYPVRGMRAQEFIALLRKLPPRLYSIASSQSAEPDEVHLTVAVVRYQAHGLARSGVASTFLADRVADGGTVPVYIQDNPNFRLPADPSTPLIMIGPGTGVAPFRAFLMERATTGATGSNWLFFGDRQFENDFLYQSEWLDYRQKGVLTRMDVAFSRDTADKIYVQHRIRQHAREVYAWLGDGAHVYVCGDAKNMAPDVHAALRDVLIEQGGQDHDGAEAQLAQLQAEMRYQRDVY